MKYISFLIVVVIGLAGCASGPKIDRARAQKIKKFAIVAFVVDQESTGGVFQDGDLARKRVSGHMMGSFNSKGQVIYGDYSEDLINIANQKISQIFNWETQNPMELRQNPTYSRLELKLNKNFLSAKSGAPRGYLRYGMKQMIFANQLYNQAPKYEKIRKTLIKALNVDAVALLSVTIDVPTDGIGVALGSLAKFESGDYKPKIVSSLSIYDSQGYVGKIEIKKKSDQTYKKEDLKQGFVQLFDQAFEESLNKSQTSIQ